MTWKQIVTIPAGGAQGDGVCANAVEGRLGQRDLPGVTQHDHQAERPDAHGGAQDQEVRTVARRKEERQDRHHNGAERQCEIPRPES
jgi:hypothetical protein